jgi:hypothetical protein
MKRLFQVSASEFPSKTVECSGCSGDALLLALEEENLIAGRSAVKAQMAEIGSLTSRFQGSAENSKSTRFEEEQLPQAAKPQRIKSTTGRPIATGKASLASF